MALRQGRTTTVGIGEESTLGTPVSRTNWMKVFSVSGFEEKISKEKIPHLYHGAAGSPTFADVYSGAVTVEGKITGVFLYEGCGMLLKAVMGANSVLRRQAPPTTHTFHMGTAIQPLTLEINRGTGGQSEIFTGCCVRSMTLTIEHGSPIKFEADIIGQKASANRSSAGSPTFAAFNKTNLKRYAAKPFHAASPVWNSVTYAIHGKTVITIDRRLEGVPVLGSRYIGDVVASDYGTVSISCDRINDGDTLYNGYKGDTVQRLDPDLDQRLGHRRPGPPHHRTQRDDHGQRHRPLRRGQPGGEGHLGSLQRRHRQRLQHRDRQRQRLRDGELMQARHSHRDRAPGLPPSDQISEGEVHARTPAESGGGAPC